MCRVRYANPVTAFPAGVQVGSTWNTTLMYDRGNAIGEKVQNLLRCSATYNSGVGTESKGLGVHVQLGPVAGPLGKIPEGGRGWEGFGSDPYLSGIAMGEVCILKSFSLFVIH